MKLTLSCIAAVLFCVSALASPPEDWFAHNLVADIETAAAPAEAFRPPGIRTFSVTPAALGRQLVRVSLPFGAEQISTGGGVTLRCGGATIPAYERVLTSVGAQQRRSLLSFLHDFPDSAPRSFETIGASDLNIDTSPPLDGNSYEVSLGAYRFVVGGSSVTAFDGDKQLWMAEAIVPPAGAEAVSKIQDVETNPVFAWKRALTHDSAYPRILEVRMDETGTVALRIHLQRNGEEGATPDLGWRVRLPKSEAYGETTHSFSSGEAFLIDGPIVTDFPDAHLFRRGDVTVHNTESETEITYYRAHESENVPHQKMAWRTATIVLRLPGSAPLNELLEPAHKIEIAPVLFDALYDSGMNSDLRPWPLLAAARQFHYDAIATSSALGDDFGNVSSMPTSGAYGMNRPNHCPPIFEAYYRSGDARLRNVALNWCSNFYDLSIWWGPEPADEYGGTRYNNRAASNSKYPQDPKFMWRSDSAVHFCTKGYDSFLYAYEETGDPRYAVALRAQVEYAKKMIHADQGEARNIGDVIDFVRLYEFTGVAAYHENALRLFRELRTKLSPGDLFSQSGAPIVPDEHFMDDDSIGYKYPFAKPYIIGYALAGLPALAEHDPGEEKLRDVIRAVADFLASSVDPSGGWRYPHPRSSNVYTGQGIEHAAQITRAARWLESRGERIENLLDASETVLRARILAFARSGTFLGGLNGWEQSTKSIPEGKTLYDLYQRPTDRDATRDYTEGSIGLGGAAPEGVVYFDEVLDFYLKHRPAERLFTPGAQLKQVLDRIEIAPGSYEAARKQGGTEQLPFGLENKLPTFSAGRVARMDFPLAYNPARFPDFNAWRETARTKFLECLLTPPSRADFDPALIATEDRGSYEARKLIFNVSADCRVPAYLLVPKSPGPHPAVIALHDHGAHFSIGKEKVVRPFGVPDEVMADAQAWVDTAYGGRFIGDELAARGYIVLAVDALFWGERGRREGVKYEEQEALSANLLQLGMCWSGVVTWDDLRSVDFLAAQPEADLARIAAVGLSMGSHRTWMLAAATDSVKAGMAICWLGDTPALMAPGNNQTKGQSSHAMLVPNLRNFLDYPDVASIACPKPMLFFNGEQDGLFPVPGVEASYAKMRAVWESQGKADQLETRLWPVPHEFNVEMQEAAFAWLESKLAP